MKIFYQYLIGISWKENLIYQPLLVLANMKKNFIRQMLHSNNVKFWVLYVIMRIMVIEVTLSKDPLYYPKNV